MGKILGNYIMPHPPIIIPEIGKGEDKKIINTQRACSEIAKEIKELAPQVVIVITPHGPMFSDGVAISHIDNISGNFGAFGEPSIKFTKKINIPLTNEIISNADELGIPMVPITLNSSKKYNIAVELDHGTMVPLYFIDQEYSNYEIVHITYGGISLFDLYKLGTAIKRSVEDEGYKAVVVGSGDLSHRLSNKGPYEYNPLGPLFDEQVINLLKLGDIEGIFNMDKKLIEGAGECGMRSIYVLLGTMQGYTIKGDCLSYEGPFGVGYGVVKFNLTKSEKAFSIEEEIRSRRAILKSNRENEDLYVRLARESLEYYLTNRKYLKVPEYCTEEMLKEKRGTFVSLKKAGELRGCIGTILPTTNSVALEIIRNAIEAGEHDLRFNPVAHEELEDIVFSVDILMPAVPATREELDPKNFGVIVTSGGRRGLLLPDLEGVDTVEEQLGIALKKGGIGESDNYKIEKFEVIRHR